MLKSHEKFHSANGKRQILIVDDELVNRELLGYYLQEEYEELFAENGLQALDLLRENRETLSLVLLDLLMPGMNGLELLQVKKEDPLLQQIPVIVVTSDQETEIESLSLGASDFISKPYPPIGVIQARVRRTIELSEDRQIINSTERDPLTGLYNREYFYRYAEQFDHYHKDLEMDAIIIDINHFHMINDRYGTQYGDQILRSIGEKVRNLVGVDGGIVCRRAADTFMVYCPHGEDYKQLLEDSSVGLLEDETSSNRVRLRMGVYPNVDKTIDIERRFDRAKMAADTVRNSFTRTIGIYDSALHEKELYAEQLIEDFHTAIEEKQFEVYYQPKFDVRPEIPALSSAEALVRWIHPERGMISPGVFIPLYEDNGLIRELDHYVWRMAAAQIREWKERLGIVVPVSVNVSRIDMYDPKLIEILLQILQENQLQPSELLLEITESAYTQDSEQIIETVQQLRKLGFQVEMDDFGTGYSSLNMISKLPVDALKLDMQFIRNAFSQKQDTRMLEVIIDIAEYLHVPVIAEGVETEEQLTALRKMGCHIVQGYYFSKPVPAMEYEHFLEEKKQKTESEKEELPDVTSGHHTMGKIAHALSCGFESIYYVSVETGHYVQFSSEGRYEDLQIETSGDDFFTDTARNIERVVYPEDRQRVALSLEREALLAQLQGNRSFSMTYRLLIDEKPEYYTLKAVQAGSGKDGHIVIGVSNVDRQLQELDAVKRPNQLDFSSLAKALSKDYFSIYYVNTLTDRFVEYSSHEEYQKLNIEKGGDDFFNLSRKNVIRIMHPEDQQEFLEVFTKERVLKELDEHGTFTITYRLLFNGVPTYVSMKATSMEDKNDKHIVIGVNNIDAEMQRRKETVTYAGIAQALAADYFSIYFVDTETDDFIEYSSHEEYQELNIEKGGSDFFNLSRKNIQRVVHPDDVGIFDSVFSKENIMRELEQNRTFTLTYRLMFGGKPTYVHMKATRMKDQNDSHIVIGVSNVDEQIRREQEHARVLRKANQDALTGVKSKHAYEEEELQINQRIENQSQEPFAIAVCDLNGLKQINDTLGHQAGDQFIKDACMEICHVFEHSPVFRIGGDEFVAILRHSDYEQREELMQQLAELNRKNKADNKVIIAGGLAVFRKGEDHFLSDVFERADSAMYENKSMLKGVSKHD